MNAYSTHTTTPHQLRLLGNKASPRETRYAPTWYSRPSGEKTVRYLTPTPIQHSIHVCQKWSGKTYLSYEVRDMMTDAWRTGVRTRKCYARHRMDTAQTDVNIARILSSGFRGVCLPIHRSANILNHRWSVLHAIIPTTIIDASLYPCAIYPYA